MTRQEAQSRADRIRLFREELAQLQSEGVLALTAEQRAQLETHLNSTLAQFASAFDIDTSDSQKQVSWGMRFASTVGGLALCAAAVLFFYTYWGLLPSPAQVALMVSAPLAAVLGAEFAARRETTLYFTSVIAIVAIAAFILDLNVLGRIFNLPSSPHAVLAWSIFGFALAYRYGLRLQLAFGLSSAIVYIAAVCASAAGAWWEWCFSRPELFLIGGALVLAAAWSIRVRHFPEFAATYRLVGLLCIFTVILVLSLNGSDSYLPLDHSTVEKLYEWIGLVGTAAALWMGILRQWPDIVTLSATGFSIFLYMRLVVWWWDWMPHYAFFLIIGGVSIGLLDAFRRVRRRLQAASR